MYKYIVPMMFSLLPACVLAASDMNEPFDFAYTIDGRNSRPMTVFNDGDVTYVQGRDKQQLFFSGVNSTMRGPYYVIKGVPDVVEGVAGGDSFKIVWQGGRKTAISNESDRLNGDLKTKSFSGTFGRIAFINGVPPDVGLVNALPKNLQLREAMKALAPHGWSGSADRAINTTQNVSVESSVGESWVVVLDRLMTALNIWVEVDSSKANLYLRDAPPKGFSVVLDSTSQLRQPVASNGAEGMAGSTTAQASQRIDSNPLLSGVNIRQIEQRNGRIEIAVMNGKTAMRFTDIDTGVPVTATVVDDLHYTLPLVDMLRVQTATGGSIDVKRAFKPGADFNRLNALGLTNVDVTADTTVFKFVRRLPQLRFANSLSENVEGTWNGNTYSIGTKAAEWKITTPQSAVQVDMANSAIFMWRESGI